MRNSTLRFVITGCALLLPLSISASAHAQAVYGYSGQQLTVVLGFSTAGATLTGGSANTDSEAEVHPVTDDAPSQGYPPDVRQSVVGFVPGADGVPGANPGENTYFRAGPSTGANWDPSSVLGNLNPGGDRSRGDADVVAPNGLINDALGQGVTMANVAESILNDAIAGDDASASAAWDLTYEFTVAAGDPTLTVTADYINELIGEVEPGLVPPSHADAAFAFSASLVQIGAGGIQVPVDLTPGVGGTSWVPAELNNTIGVCCGQRFYNLASGTLMTTTLALAPGDYVLDLTAVELTFLERQPAGPRHYQCYENHRPRSSMDVTLEDRFGLSAVEVRQAKRLCAPASKNGEDPSAPGDPVHLTAYTIRQTDPRFERVRNLTVQNQFGSFVITLTRPDMMLVPTAKDLAVPPPPLVMAPVDHFKCYKLSGARLRVEGLLVEDQFGMLLEDIKRPERFCTPAEKNGEPILDPSGHLMCFKTRQQGPRFLGPEVYTDNQFGPDQYQIFGPRELCVPTFIPVN